MNQKKQNALAVLLGYAGSHRRLTCLGLGLSAVSMVCSMVPYICIWLAARDLIAAAPDWTRAQSITHYGWIAFAFAVGGILVYFAGLMCTHLAAFRTAANIRSCPSFLCLVDGVAFYHLILGRKKAGDLFQISCSVCRCVSGGYLVVKVRNKLTRCIRNNKPEVYKLNLLQQKCKYSLTDISLLFKIPIATNITSATVR